MIGSLNNKSNTKKCFNWTYSILIFLLLVFSVFLGFKIFGKTTHTLEFSVNGISDFSIEEILDVKVYKSDNSVETLRGNKMNISDGETLRIEVSLDEGFEVSQNSEGKYIISATGIESSSGNGTMAAYNSDHFEWNTDTIKSDRNIEIYGINRKKLVVQKPTITNSSGETLNLEDFCNEWKSYIDYDEKYEFELNTNNNYEVKSVKARISEDNSTTIISSEIHETDDGNYNIILYDEGSEFGGIKNNIVDTEILLEERTESNSEDIDDKKVVIIGNEKSKDEFLNPDSNSLQSDTILFEDSLDNAASSIKVDESFEEIPSYEMFATILNELSSTSSGLVSYGITFMIDKDTNDDAGIDDVDIRRSDNDDITEPNTLTTILKTSTITNKTGTKINIKKYSGEISKEEENNKETYFYIKAVGNYSNSTPNLSFSKNSGGDKLEVTKSENGYIMLPYTISSGNTIINIEGLKKNDTVTFNVDKGNNSDDAKIDDVEIRYSDDDNIEKPNTLTTILEKSTITTETGTTEIKKYEGTKGKKIYFYIKAVNDYSNSTPNLSFDKTSGDGNLEETTLKNGYIILPYTIPLGESTINIKGLKKNGTVTFNVDKGNNSDDAGIGDVEIRYSNIDITTTDPSNTENSADKLIEDMKKLGETKKYEGTEGEKIYFYIKAVNDYSNSTLNLSFDKTSGDGNLEETTLKNGYIILPYTIPLGESTINIKGLKKNGTVTFNVDKGNNSDDAGIGDVEIRYSDNGDITEPNTLTTILETSTITNKTGTTEIKKYEGTEGEKIYFYIKAVGSYSNSTPNLSFDKTSGDGNLEETTLKNGYIILPYTIPLGESTINIKGLKIIYSLTFKYRGPANEDISNKITSNDLEIKYYNRTSDEWKEISIQKEKNDNSEYDTITISRSDILSIKSNNNSNDNELTLILRATPKERYKTSELEYNCYNSKDTAISSAKKLETKSSLDINSDEYFPDTKNEYFEVEIVLEKKSTPETNAEADITIFIDGFVYTHCMNFNNVPPGFAIKYEYSDESLTKMPSEDNRIIIPDLKDEDSITVTVVPPGADNTDYNYASWELIKEVKNETGTETEPETKPETEPETILNSKEQEFTFNVKISGNDIDYKFTYKEASYCIVFKPKLKGSIAEISYESVTTGDQSSSQEAEKIIGESTVDKAEEGDFVIEDFKSKKIRCTLKALDDGKKFAYEFDENVYLKGNNSKDDDSDVIVARPEPNNLNECTVEFTITPGSIDENKIIIDIEGIKFKMQKVRIGESITKYGKVYYDDGSIYDDDSMYDDDSIYYDTEFDIKKYELTNEKPLKLVLHNNKYNIGSAKVTFTKESSSSDNEITLTNGAIYFENGITEDGTINIAGVKIDCPEVTFNVGNDDTAEIYYEDSNGDWISGKKATTKLPEGKDDASEFYINFKIKTKGRYYLPTDAASLINNKYIVLENSDNFISLENIPSDNSLTTTNQEIYLKLTVEDSVTLKLEKIDYENLNVKFEMPEGLSFFNDKIEIYKEDPKNMIFGTDKNGLFINNYSFDNRCDCNIIIKTLEGVLVDEKLKVAIKKGDKSSNECELNFDEAEKCYKFDLKKLCDDYEDNSIKNNSIYDFSNKDITVSITGIEIAKLKFDFNDDTLKDYKCAVTINNESIEGSEKIDYCSSAEISFEKTTGNMDLDIDLPLKITKSSSTGEEFTGWYEFSRSLNKFTITIPKVTSDLYFTITENINTNSYVSLQGNTLNYMKIDKKSGDNENIFEYKGNLSEALECSRGETYYFCVKILNSNMYDLSTLKFTCLDKNSLDVGNSLNIENVENAKIENLSMEEKEEFFVYKFTIPQNNTLTYSIIGSVDYNKYTVTLEKTAILAEGEIAEKNPPIIEYQDNNSKTINEITGIVYGNDIKFKVIIPDNCSNSDFKVKYYDESNESHEVLVGSEGYYTIYNVHDFLTVKVENLKWNRYAIAFPNTEGLKFMVKNSDSGSYLDYTGKLYSAIINSSCTFKIQVNAGYKWGNNKVNVIYTENGETKESSPSPNSSGEYTLSNIKSEYVVSVEDASILNYKINFVPVDGVTYYSDTGFNITGSTISMKYGTDYEFDIGLGDNYSDSVSGMYVVVNSGPVKINTAVQKLSSTRYIIQNITGDIEIRVANVGKNKCPITLTEAEGIDYYDSSGKVITGENEVECGSNFSFRVKLYSSYSDSQIRVMLGNVELDIGDDNLYTIEDIYEAKTVTVVGIEKTAPAKLVDDINKLPQEIENSEDVDLIISASKAYDALDDSRKPEVTNYYVLQDLQEALSKYHHISNGVTLEGLGWHIKLIANPIMSNMEACARIYEKLNSEYIISLYDVYLWDTLNDQRYKLSDGEVAVVRLPTPDMSYFKEPSGIHEADNGKIDYLTLNIKSDTTSMETTALSPLGIIAKRTSEPGRSSLIDALDANLSYLTDYTLNALTGNSNNSNGELSDSNYSENSGNTQEENMESEDSEEENTVVNNNNAILGSALKLILILMIIGIILTIIFALFRRHKNNNRSE